MTLNFLLVSQFSLHSKVESTCSVEFDCATAGYMCVFTVGISFICRSSKIIKVLDLFQSACSFPTNLSAINPSSTSLHIIQLTLIPMTLCINNSLFPQVYAASNPLYPNVCAAINSFLAKSLYSN